MNTVHAMLPPPGTHNHTVNVVEGYEPLLSVLRRALDQAQAGKGSERHGRGKPFLAQPIFTIADLVGTGFQTGQAIKKVQEAEGMISKGQHEAAERELLGAINYLSATVLQIGKLSYHEPKGNL